MLCLLALSSARADLLVSSFSGHRVLRYNETNGAFVSVFIAANSGGLNLPHGLAEGPDGNLYVASGNSNTVVRFDGQTGNFLGVFAPGAGSSSVGVSLPIGLGFGPDGSLDAPGGWQALAGWTPPPSSVLQQTAVVTRALSPLTNEFYRVRISLVPP